MSHAMSCSKTKKKSKKLKKTVRCTVQDCHVEVGSKKLLRKHFKSQHGNLQSSYCCSICSKSISDISNYKKHIKVHRSQLGRECPICAKIIFKYNLARHIKSFHGPIEIVSEILQDLLSKVTKPANTQANPTQPTIPNQSLTTQVISHAQTTPFRIQTTPSLRQTQTPSFTRQNQTMIRQAQTTPLNQTQAKTQTIPFSKPTTSVPRQTQNTNQTSPMSIQAQTKPLPNQPTPIHRQDQTTLFTKQTQPASMPRQAQTTPLPNQPQPTEILRQAETTPDEDAETTPDDEDAQTTPDEEGRLLVPLQAMANGAQFVCGYCAFTTRSAYNLRRHHESLHSETRVICSRSFCNEYFMTKYMMLKHLSTCYLYCNWGKCCKKFKYQAKFDSHQRFHKNIVRRYY